MSSTYQRERRKGMMGFSCLKACGLLLAVGICLGMSYLWLYSQVVAASCELESRENSLQELRGRRAALRSRLSYLQTPAVIKDRLEERQIALVPPSPEKVVRVSRKSGAPAPAGQAGRPSRELVLMSIAR